MRTSRPKVFLSFAGDDRPIAERLREDLLRHNVEAFIDAYDIAPGADLVLSINQAMAESDHYVLLWSRHCVDRPWVEAEWATAYAIGLNERRSFLFIVRLDETDLPPLLSVRRYLDGFRDWPSVARDLATHWRGDLAMGTPVFPAPNPTIPSTPSNIAIRVCNEALGMSHVVLVDPHSGGDDLLPKVQRDLALPESESQLGGALELRFSYRLLHYGQPIAAEPLADQRIIDGSTVNLEVRVQAYGPDGQFGDKIYRGARGGLPGVSDKSFHVLVRDAFKHLLP